MDGFLDGWFNGCIEGWMCVGWEDGDMDFWVSFDAALNARQLMGSPPLKLADFVNQNL